MTERLRGTLCRFIPTVLGGVSILCLVSVSAAVAQSAAPGSAEPSETLVLPTVDPALQAGLNRILRDRPFRSLVERGNLSVALVDLSNPARLRYAARNDNRMRYAASLPKIAIMLGVFDQIDHGKLEYTPELRTKLERMIRNSDNATSSELIELVGFENIASTLRDPRYALYDSARAGGLWVGKDYGGPLGYWERDPINHISHGATARQVARFMVMLDGGTLVSPWASTEMKAIMGHPAIHHKFVLGLDARPQSRIFRKSGTWKNWHADAALVERNGKKYVAVALLESSRAKGVLSKLILRLDDLIHQPAVGPGKREAAGSS